MRTDPQERTFLLPAQSVIVSGRKGPNLAVPDASEGEDPWMLRIAEALDNTAVRLAGLLEEEQVPALPVPRRCPSELLTEKFGSCQVEAGCSGGGGLGSLGRDTVLFNPRFGPRLLLSGVVTGRAGPGIPGNRKLCRRKKKPRPAQDADAASTFARGEHWGRTVSMRSGAGP